MSNQQRQQELQQQAIKLLLLGTSSFVSLFYSLRNLKQYRNAQKKIEKLELNEELTPMGCIQKQDMNLLEQIQLRVKQSQEFDLTENEILIKDVLIKGIVKCESPIYSKFPIANVQEQYQQQEQQFKDKYTNNAQNRGENQMNKDEEDVPSSTDGNNVTYEEDFKQIGLVYRKNLSKVRYSNEPLDKIFSEKYIKNQVSNKSIEITISPQFFLVDPHDSTKSTEVHIHLPPKICSTAIDYYSERYTDKSLTTVQKLYNLISKCSLALNKSLSLYSKIYLTKGAEVGFNEYELGIKTGGLLSILGNVVYNFRDRTLKIVNPYLFIGEKVAYLQKLINRKDKKKHIFYFAGAMGILSLWFFYIEYKEFRRQKLRLQFNADSLAQVKVALVRDVNEMKCDNCKQKPKSILFKPCGHVSMCKECTLALKPKECPSCKQKIQKGVEIFFS